MTDIRTTAPATAQDSGPDAGPDAGPLAGHSLILTIVANDRPGVVDHIARTVADHQGNWMESSMARLAGQFAGIARVEVSAGRRKALLDALQDLQQAGISVTCVAGQQDERSAHEHFSIELVGSDRPGIVGQLSQLLVSHGVNVERLDTAHETGSMSATPLFRAQALVTLPEGLSVETLTEQLEALSADLQASIGPQ